MIEASRRKVLQGAGSLIVSLSYATSLTGAAAPASRLERPLPVEALDSWLEIARDGSVTAYCGHIDMGTGIQTAVAQIVADELEVPLDAMHVVMGDTGLTPDQGKSTSSRGVTLGAQPLRIAACEARHALIELGSKKMNVPITDLEARGGFVRMKASAQSRVAYGDLIGDSAFSINLELAEMTLFGPRIRTKSPLKSPTDYQVVGKSIPRFDVLAKVTGVFEFVHNVRIPGMLHGRVVRLPSFGAKLLAVDESSVAGIPDVRIVRRNDFLGVVAIREEYAVKAARMLRAAWSEHDTLPPQSELFEALRNRPVLKDQYSFDEGDMAKAMAKGRTHFTSDYQFPMQSHGMIGPSCAVADVQASGATIWSGTQWPQGTRRDMAKMLGLSPEQVRVICRPASGSYGRMSCDDAAADAAVLSQATGMPVRVQWMREDEHRCSPLSSAMLIRVIGALDENAKMVAFDATQWLQTHSDSESGHHLAWEAIGTAPGRHDGWTGQIPSLWYEIDAKRNRSLFVKPLIRNIYMRGPGAVQGAFAFESFVDELAAAAHTDPVEFRLSHMINTRDRDVLTTAARLAGWTPRPAGQQRLSGPVLMGRGIAIVRYGDGPPRVAITSEIEINRTTGKIRVIKICAGVDCGLIVNPDGLRAQVEGSVIQGISRALLEEIDFDLRKVTSRNWADYPILDFSALPEISIELINRPDQPSTAAGEISTIPVPAAIANAVFDATGRRLRQAPFTPERVRALF
jgi:CO/xanthine dehydrogenase Mo-binding subunit